MSLSYFSSIKKSKKGKEKEKKHDLAGEAPKSPVLDEEDEKFLERLAALAEGPEATPPPLPERPVVILDNGKKVEGKDAQEALMDGAQKVPLPMSPPEIVEPNTEGATKEKETDSKEKKSFMTYFNLAQSKLARSKSTSDKDADKAKEKQEKQDKKQEKHDKKHDKDKKSAGDTLHDAAEATKSSQEKEASKEEDDLTTILDQLNLAAVNNRVFSFSKESAELLDKFKLVLKDLVNGVPTAYNDLEKLLTDSETQLKKMYGNLPPFLQNLVKSLPAKMSAGLVPELLAASSEKPGFDAKMAGAGGSTGTEKKKRSKRSQIPSLKSLVSAQGAVATMLRTILNFLKLRFPMFITGTNVLMSLAVFLLLFVFWYCHKRGRETRLEGERLAAEEADSAMASSVSSFDDSVVDDKGASASQSKNLETEKSEPPLIIHDNKEAGDKPSALLEDMPDVLSLPDPSAELTKSGGGGVPMTKPPTSDEKK
jgi:hypothetical protein